MVKFKKYASALRDSVRDWIRKIGDVDILVGIPSYNNEDTIAHVVQMAAEGLKKYYPDAKTAIFVSDGGSLDDTREYASQVPIPEGVHRYVSIYKGLPGKGTSLRAVFEAANLLRAIAVVVIDADLRSITPEWVHCLAQPVLDKRADFVAPYYIRHKYDGTITNHIVYPLTRALYGKRIRQPIGGEFAFSGELAALYARQDVWDTDVAKFGIDIWMTTLAINESGRVMQAKLGAKIHDAKDPAEDLPLMFQQVVGTLFFLVGKYHDRWVKIKGSEPVEMVECVKEIPKLQHVSVTMTKLEREFLEGFDQFKPLYMSILSSESFEELQSIVESLKKGEEPEFSLELWARIIYDFAFTFNMWSRNRRRLVDVMTPLYFGRVYFYCRDVASKSWEEAEALIEEQAEVFEKMKGYLCEKFYLVEAV